MVSGCTKFDIVRSVSSTSACWKCETHGPVHSTDPPLGLQSLQCELSDPHYSAFIDLDGDCLADLFLVCKERDGLSYQIWLNDKTQGFRLARSGNLPQGTENVGFADMGKSRCLHT